MSVLTELSMFPMDKGESVSNYVSKVVEVLKNSDFPYKMGAMSSLIETDTIEESLSVVNKCYKALENDCNRVYVTIKMDIRKGKQNMMEGKIESLEKKLSN